MILCGIDIGGTKCALSIGNADDNGNIEILYKEKFATLAPCETLKKFGDILQAFPSYKDVCAIGIS